MKQFWHYLLGHPFKLVTDHAPLQWLSAQKMEGLLCRWSLAMQEYDFTTAYQKGSLNTVADSLSRCMPAEALSAATQLHIDHEKEDIHNAQRSDPVTPLQRTSAKPKVENGLNLH